MHHRDAGCSFPGCTQLPQFTDCHHLIHWAHGGDTSLHNLVLLCHHHHRLVHEGRWTLLRQPDGHLHATPPDGTTPITATTPRRGRSLHDTS
ncbi:MAG: HNH endonuclease signature motif containing protein [Frankiaceae bacterium]